MSSPARDAPSELMEMEDDDLGLTSDPIEPPSELVAPSSPVAIPPSELGPPTGYVSGLSVARHNPGLSIVRQFVLAILVNEPEPVVCLRFLLALHCRSFHIFRFQSSCT